MLERIQHDVPPWEHENPSGQNGPNHPTTSSQQVENRNVPPQPELETTDMTVETQIIRPPKRKRKSMLPPRKSTVSLRTTLVATWEELMTEMAKRVKPKTHHNGSQDEEMDSCSDEDDADSSPGPTCTPPDQEAVPRQD